MNCPVCKETELRISERQGIEIDYCPQCRGVWLDRGELDKLIERSLQQEVPAANAGPEYSAPVPPPAPPQYQQPRSEPPRYEQPRYEQPRYEKRRDDDDDDDDYRRYGKKRKRGGWLSDILDFD